MTDLIQKAREEWCEIHDPEGWSHTNVCPTYVVAALLDVLAADLDADTCPHCGAHRVYAHHPGCRAVAAEAAITRALEQKP